MKWNISCLVAQLSDFCNVTSRGCWLWPTEPVSRYPRIMINGKRQSAAAWALESTVGPRPQGAEACHSCDQPRCCNPGHLRWDTHQGNMADMRDRGRAGALTHPDRVPRGGAHWTHQTPERLARGPRSGDYAAGDDHWTRRQADLITWRGELHPAARLTTDVVREIRRRRSDGESPTALARAFGTGRGTIRAIIEGRTWKHVE
jgi:HNH endonuclease